MKNTNLRIVTIPDAFPVFHQEQFERACDRFLAMRALGEGPAVKSTVRFIPHTDEEVARWRQRRQRKEPMSGFFKQNNRRETR